MSVKTSYKLLEGESPSRFAPSTYSYRCRLENLYEGLAAESAGRSAKSKSSG